jgi:polyphenol oxidase
MVKNETGRLFVRNPSIIASFSSRDHGNMKIENNDEGVCNRRSFAKQLLIPTERLAMAKVKHGNDIAIVGSENFQPVYETDGLATGEEGIFLAVTFADCPFLMMTDAKQRIFSITHCGRKPVARDVIYNTVNALIGLGANRIGIRAAIGPGICKSCYELDLDQTRQEFGFLYGKFIHESVKAGKCYLDLLGIIRHQLVNELGIDRRHLEISRDCTCCNNDKFFSYRKEKMDPKHVKAGMAVIGRPELRIG